MLLVSPRRVYVENTMMSTFGVRVGPSRMRMFHLQLQVIRFCVWV